MNIDLDNLLRYGKNPKTTLKIDGFGTITLKGFSKEETRESLADLFAEQEPSEKILTALAAFVGTSTPSASLLLNLCQLLAQQTPTDDLLRFLADLVGDDNPGVYSLIQGQPPKKSTLKILADLVAKQAPCEETLRLLADQVAELPPSQILLKELANTLRPGSVNPQ